MSVGFSSRKAAAAARCTSPSPRSEEHTSELQSQSNLVCRLLLEKKKKILRTIFNKRSPTLRSHTDVTRHVVILASLLQTPHYVTTVPQHIQLDLSRRLSVLLPP